MTSGVVLTGGGKTVDFNSAVANNVNVTDRFSNPIIIIPTPITASQKIGENTITVNIGFVRQSYDLTFQLHDGPGSFDFSTPGSTSYEKIKYLAGKFVDLKTLTLNGTEFSGHIENVNIPWKSGMKDLTTNGTFTFTVAGK